MYYCKDTEEAHEQVDMGHCTAIDPAVLRRRHDLDIRREPTRLPMSVNDEDHFHRRAEEGRADAATEYSRPSRAQRKPGR